MTHHPEPEVLPCIWMSAGLLGYRICDRDYDCEHCPLDAALRGVDPSVETVAETSPRAMPFPEDRRYHAGHLWALALSERTWRCGLDSFAVRLLAPVRSAVLPAADSLIEADRPAYWFGEDADLIPLQSPVSGTVLRVNEALREFGGPIADSPYDDGWLAEIQVESTSGAEGLMSAGQARELAEAQLVDLRDRAMQSLSSGHPEVGATLADGGVPVRHLREALGAGRYRRLLLRYLC